MADLPVLRYLSNSFINFCTGALLPSPSYCKIIPETSLHQSQVGQLGCSPKFSQLFPPRGALTSKRHATPFPTFLLPHLTIIKALPSGVTAVSNQVTKREPIVIGSGPVSIKPPYSKNDAEADSDAKAEILPAGSAWDGR